MYIKYILFLIKIKTKKKKKQNKNKIKKNLSGNLDKMIITTGITKRSDDYRLNECHLVNPELRSKGQFSSPELCHFFTLYTDIGVKGRLLSLLPSKCASNEHRGSVMDTLDYLSCPSIWAVGVPLSGSLGWGYFSIYPISETFDSKMKLPPGAGRDPLGLSVSTLGKGFWKA